MDDAHRMGQRLVASVEPASDRDERSDADTALSDEIGDRIRRRVCETARNGVVTSCIGVGSSRPVSTCNSRTNRDVIESNLKQFIFSYSRQ